MIWPYLEITNLIMVYLFLSKSVEESHFPWVSGNIYNEDGSSFSTPFYIKEIEGVRIGIVGITNILYQYGRFQSI